MSSLEILAVLFALFVLIKLAVVSSNPKKWIAFSKKVLKNTPLIYLVYLVLTIIVGWLVLRQLTIIEVGAVMLLVSLLAALSFLPYAKKLVVLSEDLMAGIIKRSWLVIIIWVILALWILYSALIA